MSCIQNNSYLQLTADIGLEVPILTEAANGFRENNYGVQVLHMIEIVAILITLPQNCLIIHGLSKTALFHKNLCRITQVHIVMSSCGAIAQIVLFMYRTKYLQCSDTLGSKIPVVVATLVRGMFLMELTGFIVAVIIERAFASFFFADYESNLRLWIWRGIVSFLFPASFLVACLAAIPGAFAIAIYCCWLAIPIALLSSAYLFQRNRARLRYLQSDSLRFSVNYTLSIKFQLIENVRTMKIIIVVLLIMAMHSAFALALMTTAFTSLAKEPNKAYLCFVVTDLLMDLLTLIEALIAGIALGSWRRLMGRCPQLHRFFYYCLCITPPLNSIPEQHNSIQEHFDHLKQAWEK